MNSTTATITAHAADSVTVESNQYTQYSVFVAGRHHGHVSVIRGFRYFTGTKRTAFEGVKAVIASRGSDHPEQIIADLKAGIRNGRDDRENGV